jgi:hypothetical protein
LETVLDIRFKNREVAVVYPHSQSREIYKKKISQHWNRAIFQRFGEGGNNMRCVNRVSQSSTVVEISESVLRGHKATF